MALNPADIAVVSRLLDQALELPASEREAWLAALPAEHQAHQGTLRDMLAQEAQLDTDDRLAELPRLPMDDSVAQAGDRVGPYRLLREIGRGGMGSLWLAERADGAYNRQVALKLPRLAWGAGLAERMACERQIGMLLEHPNIARLYDAGVDERGRPFLALEFVDGQPIDAWCKAQALDVRARLKLFVPVTKAVAYAHGRLVVHRDLKPSNVLVTPDGQAHLLDFGIAKLLLEVAPGEPGLTQEQGRVLTPHYASPEQVAGAAITVQSDVYSLGVLLYELLTGTLPIAPKRGTPGAVEDAILEGDAPLASSRVKDKAMARALRGEVDAILAKAMQREPGRRYATADALALDIERHLSGGIVAAQPDSWLYRARKMLRRHRVGFAVGGTILMALLGVLASVVISIIQARRASEATERARVAKEFVVEMFRSNATGAVENTKLQRLPAELLLEQGGQLIEMKFARQPELQAELFGVVAGINLDIGASQLAETYARKQIATLDSLNAADATRADAELLLGRAQCEQSRYDDAIVSAQRAIQLASSDEHRSTARVLLARALWARGDTAAAMRELDLIDDYLSRRPLGPSVVRAGALSVRANHAFAAQHVEQGLSLLKQASLEALAVEGPLSRIAIDVRLKWARALIDRDRQGEAKAPREAALSALRTLGGANDIRAALEESEWASDAMEMGRLDFSEAQSTIERVLALAAKQEMYMPPRTKAKIELRLGSIYLYAGAVAKAEQLIALAASRLKPTSDFREDRAKLAEIQAYLALYSGRHEQAESLLRQALALHAEMSNGRADSAPEDYIWLAWNQQMQGRYEEALSTLKLASSHERASSGMAVSSSDPQPSQDALADLLVDAGRPAEALELLPPSRTSGGSNDRWMDYRRLTRGAALCATNQAEEGLNLLLAAISNDARRNDPNSPWLARNRAIAGHCAISLGRASIARQLAIQARAAFTVQPGVSAYFKAPLFKLERALGSAPRGS